MVSTETFIAMTPEVAIVLTAVATVVMAITSVGAGVLTWVLAKENRALRKAGTEPEVVGYLIGDHRHTIAINFVLANIGQGPAKDVTFRLVESVDGDFVLHNVQLPNNAERKPLSVLPQGERLTAFFGMGPDLFKNPKLGPFKALVSYVDLRGRIYERIYDLDISQFVGLITLGTPAEHEIAEALKKQFTKKAEGGGHHRCRNSAAEQANNGEL
jgi:hypothetical protein